jgi:hypothetical protein
MGAILSILDVAVVLFAVISLSRAVWKGPTQSSRSLALSIVLTVAFMILGLVSVSAAAGLAADSLFNQGALLLFLTAIAIVASVSWTDKPAR